MRRWGDVLDDAYTDGRGKAFVQLVTAVGLALACAAASTGTGTALAVSELCPNAAFRTGPSANLPDCRAYELVTPVEKGRTQALTFTSGGERALVAGDGERLALETIVPLEPNPSVVGARVVFSRDSALGWQPKSAVALGATAHRIAMRLFSSDLSQVALEWGTALGGVGQSLDVVIEAGPVGGSDAPVASIPEEKAEDHRTELFGASANLSDIVLGSVDHNLLSVPTGTDVHAYDLYLWTGEHLELVNTPSGALSNSCGATLGSGPGSIGDNNSAMVHAVSEDGSTIVFTSPSHEANAGATEPGCEEPTRLFMRVNGGEPIEVSAPEPGVEVGTVKNPLLPVRYNYATPDDSEVFFNTEMALTSDDASKANKLFEYDTVTKTLTRVADGVPPAVGVGLIDEEGFVFSEDGSAVYIEPAPNGSRREIYRVATATGKHSFVADAGEPISSSEPSYSTPEGEFFLFAATGRPGEDGVADEPRGAGHNELYRYDNATGSVMCVTCGSGTGPAPEQGEVLLRSTELEPQDDAATLTQLSNDGQRVFFQTTARLVPADTNSSETVITSASGTPGLDVYEWEADGADGCELIQGCTYLLSAGEDSGPSTFLGASADGRNVFLESPAQLAPQATPGFPNIYDARVDGGFAPPSHEPECLLSCQEVGAPAPLFGPGASLTFTGEENPLPPGESKAAKPKPMKRRKRHRGRSKAVGHRVRTGHVNKRGGRS